ncbi:MAG: hypothetical protein N2999_06755, partial [Proteobacteria bacterium]|nr:hypothetical protein [Pseudomonadota bacterium]
MFKTKINNVSKYEDINKIKEVLANSLNFINRPLEQHKRYLVKPNLLKPSLAESAITTHPAIIRAVIE